jgi:hypothetical protein
MTLYNSQAGAADRKGGSRTSFAYGVPRYILEGAVEGASPQV